MRRGHVNEPIRTSFYPSHTVKPNNQTEFYIYKSNFNLFLNIHGAFTAHFLVRKCQAHFSIYIFFINFVSDKYALFYRIDEEKRRQDSYALRM